MGKCLGPTEFCFGRANRTCCGQHPSISFEHGEARALICEPFQSRERDESVRADDDEPLQPMPHASKSDSPSLWTNAILDFEMATLHSHFDAVAGERQNATLANRMFAGKVCLR
jgi:hypothetical protein